ncbi:HPr kinase/phosphorylase [Fredinandcohnia humi]
MINTRVQVCYKAFGYKILSEIILPELHESNFEYISADLEIGFTDLYQRWEESEKVNKYFVINEEMIMFCVPDVAIFSIQSGKQIYITKLMDAHDDQIRLYLLGTCMGILLMQRKILPLHGSAIEINGKAYAIIGDSGVGKSTLAAAFLNNGYRLLSDDVIPISFNETNQPMVTPAYPQQKLWQESLDNFGMESKNLRPIINRETKFAIPVANQFSNEQLPLAGVFELVKTESSFIRLQPIQNLARLQTLFCHTYRNFLIEPQGLMDWHFNTIAKLASKLDVFQLVRPTSRFTAHELTTLILSTIERES